MILETERLFLREMRQNDFRDLAEILQNPNVMYAYEHDFSEDDVQVWLDRQIDRYKKYGFGLWAVILKNTNEMIGQAGLTIQPYKNAEVLEIGYLLKERFWPVSYTHLDVYKRQGETGRCPGWHSRYFSAEGSGFYPGCSLR